MRAAPAARREGLSAPGPSAPLDPGLAIVVLGPSGTALARRLRDLLPGASLHGPRAQPDDWDEAYDALKSHLARLFAEGRPIIGLCASGILIRALASQLDDKHTEPPVVAVAEDGSVAVPLLGGHHGANTLARAVAAATGGVAAITTAGDVRLGFALGQPPAGWRITDPTPIKHVTAALIAGRPVALVEEAGGGGWLRDSTVPWSTDPAASHRVVVTDRAIACEAGSLVVHPPVLALGIGCERGCSPEEVADLALASLAEAGLSAAAVGAIVSIELKLGEPAIQSLADRLRVPARFIAAPVLLAQTERLTERSEPVFRATGCWGVAEGAALAAVGPGGTLIVAKRKSRRATCAIARAPHPIEPAGIGRGRGSLALVGIGPGDAAWRTPEASAALAEASDIVGYRLYLDLLGRAIHGKTRHDGVLGGEEDRARQALDLAASGRSVALVSSGDIGIYGLATLVFELLDRDERPDWAAVAVRVCPGISAVQAAAARAGAPLGHDFCAISLSDLLTSWETIANRLEAAGVGDFVVALYNPRSARRSTQLADAAAILLRHRPAETPVLLSRNLGRPGESISVVTLGELAASNVDQDVDMLTLVLVGSRSTRRMDGEPARLYTPRGYLSGPR